MSATKKVTMESLVKEYNKLRKDKKPITRFASLTEGRKRLATAKMSIPKKGTIKKTIKKVSGITANGKKFRNIWEAVMSEIMGGTGKYTKFRSELTEKGSAKFKGITFKVAK